MSDRDLAEVICRALVMVLRALDRRFGFEIWILSRDERRQVQRAMDAEKDGVCARTLRNLMMDC